MIEYLLDAHALIWHLEDHPALGTKAGAILDSPESKLILPTIALAEALWIVGKGRTNIGSVHILLTEVNSDSRVEILPLTRDIVTLTADMPRSLEMHDRQIIASTLWLIDQGKSVALLTKDEAITNSGLVPVIW